MEINHEEEPQRNPVTIEEIASLAKENLLRDGKHAPTVIVDGDKAVVTIRIKPVRTSQECQRQLFQAGFALAKTKELNDLQQVFLISEGWMSVGGADKTPDYPPSQDPDRKEILLVSSLTVPTAHNEVKVWEIIRDQTGMLLDLKEFDTGVMQAQSPLLNAFLTGFTMVSSDRAD